MKGRAALLAASVTGALSLACTCEPPRPTRTGDEALVFMAEDLLLERPDLGLDLDPERGVFERTDGAQGSFKLSYEYRSAPDEKSLFIGSYVIIRPDVEAAQTAYATSLIMADVGLSGMATEPRPDLMAWGDERECKALMAGGREVGESCIARGGRFVVMLMVSGVAAFTEAGSVDDALAPQLASLTP